MTETMQADTGKELFEAILDERTRGLSQGAGGWLEPLRAGAAARFRDCGLPHDRQEAWRRTSIAPVKSTPFAMRPAETDPERARAMVEAALLDTPGPRLVFVDGRFAPALSSLDELPRGLTLKPLARALDEDRETLEPRLGKILSTEGEDRGFPLLNTALFEDGCFVHVARNAAIAEPVQVVYAATAQDPAPQLHPRSLVLLETGAALRLLEHWVGEEGSVALHNSVFEADVADNARLEHYKIQRESRGAFHLASIQTRQGRDSHFASYTVSLGSAIGRNEIGALVGGENSEAVLNGLYLGSGRQLLDTQTKIDHAVPNCNSHELYKGILDERAHGVFCGAILVRQDAQKTDAIQSSRAMLLTETATAHSQPQLEIYADDVKCTHGSTVGQLDREPAFYMQSRGIDLATANRILTFAFANDLIDTLPLEPLRERVTALLDERLAASDSLKGK